MARINRKIKARKKEKDIVKFLKDFINENKEFCASAIVIIGLFITILEYVYMQGYYSFFGIDDSWINAGDTGIYYKLVLPLCMSILLIFSNLVSALPFILKRKKYVIVWYELSLLVSVYSLMLYNYFSINTEVLVISLIIEFIALLLSLDNNKKTSTISFITWNAVTIAFVVFMVLGGTKLPYAKDLIILFILLIIAFGISIILILPYTSKKIPQNNLNTEINKKDAIKDKNDTFKLIVLMIAVMLALFGFLLYCQGFSKAENQKIFEIIHLSEEEYYQNIHANSTNKLSSEYDKKLYNNPEEMQKILDEIKKNDIPYIKIIEEINDKEESVNVIRRAVNAYVVMASDAENYIVINGYIDQDSNILYYFSAEQKIIEKQDVIINKIEFANAQRR